MDPHFSLFSTTESKNRKSCKWCGARCLSGITIRGKGRNGIEKIRGFCCPRCAFRLGVYVRQMFAPGEFGYKEGK